MIAGFPDAFGRGRQLNIFETEQRLAVAHAKRAEALEFIEHTPDALDYIVTAKNHDLKAARIERSSVEQWFYALIALQTMEGFLGRGNYGISRMNSGFGSRPLVGLAPAAAFAGFPRDVEIRHRRTVEEALEGLTS